MSNAFFRMVLITNVLIIFLWSCQSDKKQENKSQEFNLALERNIEVSNQIKKYATDLTQQVNSPYAYINPTMLFYENRSFLPFWSDTGDAKKHTLSFLNFLDTCEYNGLVKDYFDVKSIQKLWKTINSEVNLKKQSQNWAVFDVALTNAFFNVCNDLKRGRLYPDSLSWKNDKTKYRSFFISMIDSFSQSSNCNTFFSDLQPQLIDYKNLRNEIKGFLKNKDTTNYTFVEYRLLKSGLKDSLKFYNNLFKRFLQESLIDKKYDFQQLPDSLLVAQTIASWQKKHELTEDGKISEEFTKAINQTDHYKYLRLILTLDRYKLLPDTIGATFVNVNLPAFELKVWDNDTVALFSNIICGRQYTPTPQLSSEIKEIVTMPTWTVPPGILRKEMLPQLKKNPGYLSKKGLSLYDLNGRKVNPHAIDWSKYQKGIPFKIMQKSGIRNALGVIKFNFVNNYYVYLHDTNERYLYQRKKRALSHGCVRVEKWMELANLIARKDSLLSLPDVKLNYNSDSISNYIANHKNKIISIRHPIPIYINYFSVASVDGKLVFYNDIYNDDERVINKYFSSLKLQK